MQQRNIVPRVNVGDEPLLAIPLPGRTPAIAPDAPKPAAAPPAHGTGVPGDFLAVVSSPNEKFADPFYTSCTLRGRDPSDLFRNQKAYFFPEASVNAWGFKVGGFTTGLGYEYLAAVPNVGSYRVAAMRAKIDALGKSSSDQVDVMVGVSVNTIRDVGIDLARQYREAQAAADSGDTSKITSLATRLGIPTDQVQTDYKKINDILSYYSPESKEFLTELWKSFSPQVLGVMRDVVGQISKSITGTATEMSADTAALLGNISAAVPAAGQAVKIILDLYSAWQDRLSKSEAAACKVMNDRTKAVIDKTFKLNLPVPLHVLEVYPNAFKCASDTEESTWAGIQQEIAQTIYYDNLLKLVGNAGYVKDALKSSDLPSLDKLALPISDQEIISWWWGLATTMMSHSEVEPVFRAMGRDVKGGSFASDEQVMLVAAPVAAAYGMDVDALAIRIWNACKGWKARPELFAPVDITESYYDGSDLKFRVICSLPTVNAMQIQWSELAKTAFAIAEADKNKNAGTTSSTGSFVIPVVLGGGSAVAGFMLGGPIGAVIGGGLGWFLGSKL